MNLALLAATALPFVVSPGASFTITVNAATGGDRRAPLRVWAGTSLGLALIAAVVSISGVGRLLGENEGAHTVVGVTGGAALIAFGAFSVVRAVRWADAAESLDRPRRLLAVWSFVAVITNAKALTLYALVVPFLPGTGLRGTPLSLTFAAVHVVMLLAWLSLVGMTVRLVPILSASHRARGILALLTALILVALGVRALVSAAV